MARLPFGRNPFADAAPTLSEKPRPSASVLERQTIPISVDKDATFHQKRKNVVDLTKQDPKKNKVNEEKGDSLAGSAASFFGSIASENYSEGDIEMWKNRKETDAEYNFKLGLGDAFYHGLTLMKEKNSIIQNQKKAITRYREDITTLKGQVTDYHGRYHEEIKARKDDAVNAQKAIDKQHEEAKQAQEALLGENTRLQARIDELEASMKQKEGAAYSLGFLDYLRNFLAADPEYDWSSHFAPSTPAFMSHFKEENSTQIIEARSLLDDQIKEELEKVEAEQARNQGENPPKTQNPSGASPSDPVAK